MGRNSLWTHSRGCAGTWYVGSVPGRVTDTNKGSPGPALLTRGTGSWIAGVAGLRDVGERLLPTRGARNLSCTRGCGVGGSSLFRALRLLLASLWGIDWPIPPGCVVKNCTIRPIVCSRVARRIAWSITFSKATLYASSIYLTISSMVIR